MASTPFVSPGGHNQTVLQDSRITCYIWLESTLGIKVKYIILSRFLFRGHVFSCCKNPINLCLLWSYRIQQLQDNTTERHRGQKSRIVLNMAFNISSLNIHETWPQRAECNISCRQFHVRVSRFKRTTICCTVLSYPSLRCLTWRTASIQGVCCIIRL